MDKSDVGFGFRGDTARHGVGLRRGGACAGGRDSSWDDDRAKACESPQAPACTSCRSSQRPSQRHSPRSSSRPQESPYSRDSPQTPSRDPSRPSSPRASCGARRQCQGFAGDGYLNGSRNGAERLQFGAPLLFCGESSDMKKRAAAAVRFSAVIWNTVY